MTSALAADVDEVPGPGLRHVGFSFYMQGIFWNEQSMTLRVLLVAVLLVQNDHVFIQWPTSSKFVK